MREIALAGAIVCGATNGQSSATPPSRDDIKTAINRGVQHLLDAQSLEGRWFWERNISGGRAGATGLALLALLKSGVDPQHGAIRRGLASLESNQTKATYDATCVLLALLADDPKRHTQWIQSLVHQLSEEQVEGVWGYPSTPGDLSNTQYAALALWSAKRHGFEVADTVWKGLAEALPRYAKRKSGFVYRTDKGKATVGMTAAGIGCIAICRDMLGPTLGSPIDSPRLVAQIDKLYDDALRWLGNRYSVRGIRRLKENGIGYYMYSIERVGALTGRRELGKVNWYDEGARFLLEEQRDDGSWSHLYASSTGTSFALLFLSRATAGPITGDRTNEKPREEQEPNAMAPWLVELARDFGRNAVAGSAHQATASSARSKKKNPPSMAFDGDRSTAWECRERDKNPHLRVEFAAAVRSNVILIGHPYDGTSEVPVGRAITIEVIVNDSESFEIEMPPHPLKRGSLALDPAIDIRTLELRFPNRVPHRDGTDRIGVSEVELQVP